MRRPLRWLVGGYVCLSLINLGKLPIFNDEAIYLDWGWSGLHQQGAAFTGLFDGKQPLTMWLFAIANTIIPDPLLAGRLVSVGWGVITLLGIYRLTRRLTDKQTALMAAVLFAITPLFMFYNRLALMEAAVAAIGIWIYITMSEFLDHPSYKQALLLAVWTGLGIWIKTSAYIFVMMAYLMVSVQLVRTKKTTGINQLFVSLISCFLITLPLLVQPQFWGSLASNQRYILTVAELIRLPFGTWIQSGWGLIQVGIVFITPGLFGLSLIGMIKTWKKAKHCFIFFGLALLVELFTVRYQSQRYLMPYVVWLVIPAALGVSKKWIGLAGLVAGALTLVQIINPVAYVKLFERVTPLVDREMVYGQTSGFGIAEAIDFLTKQAATKRIIVGYGLNAGNPENALDIYLKHQSNIRTLYLDEKLIPEVRKYDCLTAPYSVYYISRYEQQSGLERFFTKIKTIQHPFDPYSIGIYTLKQSCKGQSFPLVKI